MPGRAGPYDVVMRIIERSRRSEKVGEEQIAIDQPINSLVACALLERSQSFASDREQIAPAAAAQDFDRRQRGIALRRAGDEKPTLLSSSCRDPKGSAQFVLLP